MSPPPREENPYLAETHAVLPRLLALYDTDGLSPTRGLGDRFYWAWKLIDFPNATFQGAAHGLARLWAAGLLPDGIDADSVAARVGAMVEATRAITRRDGSVEEAFPGERSWCVTALVAYDLLCAGELMGERLDRGRTLETVAPLARFLMRREETHAFISNHLATGAAALARWARAAEEPRAAIRAHDIVARILARQSDEGWLDEYGGADPGYQSLATCYLADLDEREDLPGLAGALDRSVEFLAHFAHPDGSFGGLYGSRNTRFWYPAGVEHLATRSPAAAALAAFMRASVARRSTVTVTVVDEPNLVPLFNAYARAATLVARAPATPDQTDAEREGYVLPCAAPPLRKHFAGAGLVVDRGAAHYTVVSTHKGGVALHVRDGEAARIDAGAAASDGRGRTHTAQTYDTGNAVALDGDRLSIVATMRPLAHPLPGPLAFIALRVAALTVFRFDAAAGWIKRALVRYLITRRGRSAATNRRTIVLGADLAVSDELDAPPGWRAREAHAPFSVIHMASQGYWQRQDDAGARDR